MNNRPYSQKDVDLLTRWAMALAWKFCAAYPYLDPSDVFSHAHFGIASACARYNPERNALFSTYAQAMVKGHIHHALRNAKHRPMVVMDPDAETGEICDAGSEAHLKALEIKAIVSRLDPVDRELVTLVWIDGNSVKDASLMTGATVGFIKKRLRLTRLEIRSQLGAF